MAWANVSPQARKRKKVMEVIGDEFTDDHLKLLSYWIRNMEPGEKVVVRRF